MNRTNPRTYASNRRLAPQSGASSGRGRIAHHAGLALVALQLAACASDSNQPRLRGNLASRIEQIDHLVRAAAQRHRVEPMLVLGVIYVESRFRPNARSAAGARGLMQLMPRTAASLARRLRWQDPDLEDPAFNIEAGTAYLAHLLRIFDGDHRLALAAYNTGPARVRRWLRAGRLLPAYSRRYVRAVQSAQAKLAQGRPRRTPTDQRGDALDRSGLRQLLRERLYGIRHDEPLAAKSTRH